jgi:creatinine deaminase
VDVPLGERSTHLWLPRCGGIGGKHPDKLFDMRLETEGVHAYDSMMAVALDEARLGRSEGGIPIGAALYDVEGRLLASGHNRRVQDNDPSVHGETDAFRRAGRQRSYRDITMVTTLAPCWYCSGLIRQFGFRTVIVGESRNFSGGVEWLRSLGVKVIDLDSEDCAAMLASYIQEHPDVWNEDIGED